MLRTGGRADDPRYWVDTIEFGTTRTTRGRGETQFQVPRRVRGKAAPTTGQDFTGYEVLRWRGSSASARREGPPRVFKNVSWYCGGVVAPAARHLRLAGPGSRLKSLYHQIGQRSGTAVAHVVDPKSPSQSGRDAERMLQDCRS